MLILIKFLKIFIKKFLKKVKNYFLESICSFYLGFYLGNLFSSLLNNIRNKIIWDGIILLIIIYILETFNYIIYLKKFKNKKLLIILKSLQIGILLGFFIDAFKVGS